MYRKAFKAVFTSILVLVAVAFLGVGVAARTGHLHLQTVLSGSMRPGTQPGDLIATWKVPTSSLHVGDVIVFYPPGQTVKAEMHRIVSITKVGSSYKVITKGDANRKVDPWNPVILSSPTSYRRVAVMPGLGWVSAWASGVPQLRSILLILAGLLFAWVAIKKTLSGDSRKGRAGTAQFFVTKGNE